MRYIKIIILLLISNSLFGQKIVTSGGWITSNFQYLNDTLLLTQNRLKIKSNNGDNKIIIDNRKPFTYTSGAVTASDKIMEIFPPVNRNVATADTTPSFYLWNDYTKFQTGQTGDNVIGFGLNLINGNAKQVNNFPAVGISMENWFQPNVGGEGLTEFITHFAPRSGSIYRPFSWYGNNNTGVMDIQFRTDRMSITNRATIKEVFNLTGGQVIFRGEEATGSGATPRIFFEDQRNTSKRSSIVCDTGAMSIAGAKLLQFGCNDVAGWIQLTQRIGDTKLLFGKTNSKNRVFFETEDDGSGYYKSGGAILLGGYCSLSKVANNAYGAVGSNYYLDNSGVLKRAGADVSSGWNFENGGARFWSSPSGAADGAITLTHKASFDIGGNLAIATANNPAYSLDVPTTNAVRIPSGNTAQRPTGARGVIRYNLQTWKYEAVRHGTTYERFFMLEDTLGATAGQVLTYNSGVWAPQTNTSESTTIGTFQSSGNSNGLTLSGTDIRLHAASVSTPGGVNVGQQTFGVGADTKIFNGTGSGQITVDGNTDNTVAGINFTQQGTDLMGIVHMNSSDADNAQLRLALEQDGGLVDQMTIGTLNDSKGMYSRNGLYEDITTVTTSPYTVLYGDRNIYLDGTTITVNLQAIGTSTAETKIGRVIYFFNDNATNVTITPNGSETINDSASLTLLPNTGVTLLAVTGTKWVTRD